jgi:tRNA uridine 5-carbamoylmethylation protein Kti12
MQPLVVICGRPCVGKTTVANALAQHLEGVTGTRPVVINEEALGLVHAEAYKGP